MVESKGSFCHDDIQVMQMNHDAKTTMAWMNIGGRRRIVPLPANWISSLNGNNKISETHVGGPGRGPINVSSSLTWHLELMTCAITYHLRS